MQYSMLMTAILALGAYAAPSAPATAPVASLEERAELATRATLPKAAGTGVLKAAQTVKAGQSFDGGMKQYDRGVKCTGQAEGGDKDAVFILEKDASLSNVIIGPNQIEGIHCQGGCNLKNVWWSKVCEDAFTIKVQDAGQTTSIQGGGAFGAENKVIQHNGAGTVAIKDFTVDTFGKLYRACGNCKTSYERHVVIDGITASKGKKLVGINSNFGDTAVLRNVKAKNVKDICTTYTGTKVGSDPRRSARDLPRPASTPPPTSWLLRRLHHWAGLTELQNE